MSISGNDASRVFQVDNGVTATLSGLTISGGAAASGGGLYNLGTAELADCTLSGNSATSYGGGLDNHGTVMLTACTISGNNAQEGGGVANYDATTTLTDCTISGNTAGGGGGVADLGATTVGSIARLPIAPSAATLPRRTAGACSILVASPRSTGCTVSGNSATLSGGGQHRHPPRQS